MNIKMNIPDTYMLLLNFQEEDYCNGRKKKYVYEYTKKRFLSYSVQNVFKLC